MKTKLHLFIFFSLLTITVSGQFKILAEGDVFEEPEDGLANITQLSNGNTLFLRLKTKRHFKIEYDFYNASHKKIYSGEFTPTDDNLALQIENIFEIGGNVAVFLRTNINHIPVLQRLVINGKDGTIGGVTTVDEISPRPANPYDQIYGIGGRLMPQIIKSATNNRYVVVSIEREGKNSEKKLRLSLFDDNHKLVKTFTIIDSAGEKSYMHFGDIAFIDDNKIAVVCGASMRPGTGQKDVVIVDFKNNSQRAIPLPAEYEWPVVDEKIKFNLVANQVLILTSSGDLKKDLFLSSSLKAVDLTTKNIVYTKKIAPTDAMKKNIELFGTNRHESMALQNFFTDNNGNAFVIFEGTEISTWQFTSGRTSTSTILGNLVVIQYDKKGNETGSLLIPKSQKSIDMEYSIIHDGGAFYPTAYLVKGTQYKSFIYFLSRNKNYIFLNDSPDNTDKMKKGKLETSASSKDGEAYYIDLTEKNQIPNRNQIFSNKENKKEVTPALFAVADYDILNNIYVTIKLDTKGKDQGMRLVWLQPQ